MKSRLLLALLLAGAGLFSAVAHAQSSTVTGRVTDAAGRAPLPGALVTLRQTGEQTATNHQGEFVFGAVAPGQQTIDVSYLGYGAASTTVEASPGERSTVAVLLRPTEVHQLDAMIVSSIRDGTARALNQQRTAASIGNVVASDAIGRFPDPNIAEALQRVPGIAIARDQGEGRYINVRGAPSAFTSVQIDGVSIPAPAYDTRAVDLDTIPSDIVNLLEISKAVRPDQDADAIAGSVNIVTQSPFDHTGFSLRGSGGMSYNDFGGTHDTRGSFTIGNIFGERRFGLIVSGSYSKTRRQLDNVENVWVTDDLTNPQYVIEETLFKDYDTNRERQAITAQLEWRPTITDRLYLRGSFSRFTDDEFRNRLGIQWADGTRLATSTNEVGNYSGIRLSKQVRHRTSRNEIATLVAGGEHALGSAKLDYSASLARSDQNYPRRDELLYRTGANIAATYDISRDANTPYYSIFETGQHLELNRYSFRENTKRKNTSEEDEQALAASLSLPVRLAGAGSSLKVGAKYRSKEKTHDEERRRGRSEAGVIQPDRPLAELLGSTPSENYSYRLGHKFDPALADAYFDRALGNSPRRPDSSVTADYRAEENILATYGMLNLDLGALDVLAGVRVERTEFDGEAPRYNNNTGAITTQQVGRSYTNTFPGVHARYGFSDTLIGRASFTRGIARPRYADLVPYVTETTDGAGSRVSVSSGNPALNATLSDNFDGMIEYYFKPIGIVSAGVFHKEIEDFIFTANTSGTFNSLPATFTRPENARDGKITGIELSYQQQFAMLPGWFSGFGTFANYTWTDSEVTAPIVDPATGLSTLSRKVQLPGQSKTSYNVGVYYERRGFNVRLSYNKRSDYIDAIDIEVGGPMDLWWEGRGQLDLTSSYRLRQGLDLFVEAKNLTNTAGVRYRGERRFVEEYEKFGYSIFAGLKFNL